MNLSIANGSYGYDGSGAGGGGIGILATGNVTIGPNGRILANGGSVYSIGSRSAGGGSGGSVRIIANGNVTIAGIVKADGGTGGWNNQKANNSGGGGAGGRIAIFYGDGYACTGTMTADGGAPGICTGSTSTSNGHTLAEPGSDGTIYIVDSSVVSPKKASAPTPKDGDSFVYAPSASTSCTLSWYSGYKATTDRVWFGTDPGNLVAVGTVIPATRGQHSVTVSIDPCETYYWKVMTDTTISSDLWSFRTVGWRCMAPDYDPEANPPRTQIGWPDWDKNGDCVVSGADLWYLGKYWRVDRGGTQGADHEYLLSFGGESGTVFYFKNYIADWWLECRGRSDNGCDGW